MSKKSKSSESEQLVFAKALNGITKIQDSFIKAVEGLQEYSEDALTQLDLQINTKKDELARIEEDIKKRKKDAQIECDQFIKEYEYEAALKILTDRNEEPINCDKLQELRDNLERAKKDYTTEIEKIRDEEKAKNHKELSAALKSKDLTHVAETAQMKALADRLTAEIDTYTSTIETLKHEIASQRKLTKEVAEACKQGGITQQIGK